MSYWRIIQGGLWIGGLYCGASFAVEHAEFSIAGVITPPLERVACYVELVNSTVDLGEINAGSTVSLKGEVILKISCELPRIVGFLIHDAYGAETSESDAAKKKFRLNAQKEGLGLETGYYFVQPKECHQLLESGQSVPAYLSDRAGSLAEQNPKLQPGQLYFPLNDRGEMVPSRGFFGRLGITVYPNKNAVGEIYGLATIDLDYF